MKNARIKVLNSDGKILGTFLVPNDGARKVELEVAPEHKIQIVSADEQFVQKEFLTFAIGLAQLPGANHMFRAANAGDLPIEVLRRVKGFEECVKSPSKDISESK